MSHFETTTIVAQPRLAGLVGDVQVLVGEALRRVDQHQRDVGVLRRVQGAHLGPVLDLLAVLAHAAQAGRVDQPEVVSPTLSRVSNESRVVPGMSRHDRARLAAERVEEGRLADVRAAQDDDADLVGHAHVARRALDPRRRSTMWSSRSPESVPWMAEMGNGSPRPSS